MPKQLPHHKRPNALAALNARLDAALDERVRLHRARAAKESTVREYLDGLKAVRDVEAELEPRRRELGATHSRAFEHAIRPSLFDQEAAA